MSRRPTAGGLPSPEKPICPREAESVGFERFSALFVTRLKHGVAARSKSAPFKRESCNCVCKRVAELSGTPSNRAIRKDRVGACLQRLSDLSDVPCGSALRLRPHKGSADLL